MRFFFFIVGLAVVLGSSTVVYLHFLNKDRPPAAAPAPSRADRLKALIDKGDPKALVAMGDLYRTGTGGMHKNLDAAFRLYRAAARKGYPPAQFAVGRAYELGEGVRENAGTAAHWYEPAAEFGHDPDAEYAMGRLYDKGIGVAYDPARALDFYLKAAAGGQPVAQYLAGVAYEQGRDGAPDLIEAYRYYLLAADHPDAVRAANPEYDPLGALTRVKAETNRSQREMAEKQAAQTRKGYSRR